MLIDGPRPDWSCVRTCKSSARYKTINSVTPRNDICSLQIAPTPSAQTPVSQNPSCFPSTTISQHTDRLNMLNRSLPPSRRASERRPSAPSRRESIDPSRLVRMDKLSFVLSERVPPFSQCSLHARVTLCCYLEISFKFAQSPLLRIDICVYHNL